MSRHLIAEADADRPVTVAVGDQLVIELPENGTTGFLWALPELPEWLSVESDSVRRSSTAPGAGGTRVVELRATAAGRADLTLTLARPWPGGETDRQARFPLAAVPGDP